VKFDLESMVSIFELGRFKSSGMWHYVGGLIFPIVWGDYNISVFRDKLSDPAHPRNWRHSVLLNGRNYAHSDTVSHPTNSILRTWNIRLLGCASTCLFFPVFDFALVGSLSIWWRMY
jgi:hypothetical protein